MRKAVPGFPDNHRHWLAEIVNIPDPPSEEVSTNAFRPRFAVDCRLINADGTPRPRQPVLQDVPLPASMMTGGGITAGWPPLGTRVLIAYADGDSSQPYIINTYPMGGVVPTLARDDAILSLPGFVIRATAAGVSVTVDSKLTVIVDGLELTAGDVDSSINNHTAEVRGSRETTVDGTDALQAGGALNISTAAVLALAAAGKLEMVGAGGASLAGKAISVSAAEMLSVKTSGNLAMAGVKGFSLDGATGEINATTGKLALAAAMGMLEMEGKMGFSLDGATGEINAATGKLALAAAMGMLEMEGKTGFSLGSLFATPSGAINVSSSAELVSAVGMLGLIVAKNATFAGDMPGATTAGNISTSLGVNPPADGS